MDHYLIIRSYSLYKIAIVVLMRLSDSIVNLLVEFDNQEKKMIP